MRLPGAARRDLDDESLAAEMLDVPGRVSSGHVFEERCELLSQGRGGDRPGLDRRVPSLATLEMADERLRQAGALSDVCLPKSRSHPAVAKADPEAPGKESRPGVTCGHRSAGAPGSAEATNGRTGEGRSK